ncbi:MAG: DUF4153 domain-containing protein [Lachnospiraceae bacterium]
MNENLTSGISGETEPIKSIPIEAVWQAAAPAAAKEEEPYPQKRSDRWMAGVMFILAYLAVDILGIIRYDWNYGVGATLFTVIYGIAIIIYARKKDIKVQKEGWFWFSIILMTGFSCTIIDNHTLEWFASLFLCFSMIYFPLILFGVGVNGGTSEFFLLDGFHAFMIIPLKNFRAQWKFTRKGMQKVKMIGTIVKAFLGVLISIPLFMMVAGLLSSADSAFGELLYELSWNIEDDVTHFVGTLLLSLPVGCYLFGLIYGAANRRGTSMISKDSVVGTCKAFAIVPAVSIYAAMTGICLLYMMFIFLQGSYYISAIRGILPAGFTYSEYARQGFFELVEISMINITVLVGVEFFCRTKGRLLKAFRFLLSLLTIFLIVTAMTKMMLYIQAYGLTQLRVIPSAFMIYLAVVFVLIMVAQFRPLPVVKLAVCTFALGFSVMTLSNMDGQIAKYNLSRYQAGTLQDLPETTLIRCGASSIPEIYKAWENEQDPDRKERWEQIVRSISRKYDYRFGQTDGIKTWNLARMNADVYSYDKMGIK